MHFLKTLLVEFRACCGIDGTEEVRELDCLFAVRMLREVMRRKKQHENLAWQVEIRFVRSIAETR